MYETVKTVNGHRIYHMVGSKGIYHVNTGEAPGAFRSFRTIKAAAQFIESEL